MRYILPLLCILFLHNAFAVESAKIDPTAPDRVQAFIDPETGKVERLEIFDANSIVDSVGNTYKTPLRQTIVTRAEVPALFAALDMLLAKTAERDAANRAKKVAEEAARAAAAVPK